MSKPRQIEVFNSFKKTIKKHYMHLVSEEWAEVIYCLVNRLPLPEQYKDHPLKGSLKAYRDCHVKNDLVLLYKISADDTIVELHYLDTHSEIFKNAS